MTRPAVLIVEPSSERRRQLSHGLAAEGYEVVPAASAEDGERFARGLGPAVIVAPADLARFGDGSILDGLAEPKAADAGIERTLLLLGEGPEEDSELPVSIVFLPVDNLSTDEIVRRIRLVLIGREVGVEADSRLEALVGDLALRPFLELLRSLARALVSGRVEFEHGALDLERGAVTAARCGATRGLKAFCGAGWHSPTDSNRSDYALGCAARRFTG